MHDRRRRAVAEDEVERTMHEYCCCSPWCNCGYKEKSDCDHEDDREHGHKHCCCCCKPKRKRICYPVYPDICNGCISCTLSC